MPDNANTGQSITDNQQNISKPTKVNTHYLYGDKDATYFDTINPILIGFFVFFFIFNFWHRFIKRELQGRWNGCCLHQLSAVILFMVI